MPPASADMSATKVSSGSAKTRAMMRGRISTSIGAMPMTRSASISSRIFIEPSSAVMAEPERPAIMMEVSSTPSSRSDQHADQVDGIGRGAEAAKLENALLRDDAADQEIDRHDDRHGAQREDFHVENHRGRPHQRGLSVTRSAAAANSPRKATPVMTLPPIMALHAPSLSSRCRISALGARAGSGAQKGRLAQQDGLVGDRGIFGGRARRRDLGARLVDQPGAGGVEPADAGEIDGDVRRALPAAPSALAAFSSARDPAIVHAPRKAMRTVAPSLSTENRVRPGGLGHSARFRLLRQDLEYPRRAD